MIDGIKKDRRQTQFDGVDVDGKSLENGCHTVELGKCGRSTESEANSESAEESD